MYLIEWGKEPADDRAAQFQLLGEKIVRVLLDGLEDIL